MICRWLTSWRSYRSWRSRWAGLYAACSMRWLRLALRGAAGDAGGVARLSQPLHHRSRDDRDLRAQRLDRHRDQLLLEAEQHHAVHGRKKTARGDAEFG